MGGNVTIGDHKADRIDLNEIDRFELAHDLVDFANEFKKLFGAHLCASGSTDFLFDPGISTDELLMFKPTFGDIDFQIDKTKMPSLTSGLLLAEFELIGGKMTTNTLVTLWKYRGKSIQIDFEGVDFDGGIPTEWAKFSYSASWADQLSNVKGVAHKYIFRALTARTLSTYTVRRKTKTVDIDSSAWAFSNRGLRKKFIPADHGEWFELKPGETAYITDLKSIFQILISDKTEFTHLCKLSMWSYCGVLGLIEKFVPKKEWRVIADGMANLLWAKGAQRIYPDEWEDQMCKQRIMMVLSSTLNIEMNTWDELIKQYYGSL